MNAAAWICLALPLSSTLAIAGAGTRISRRGAGYLSTATTFGAFAAALVAFVVMLGKNAGDRTHATTSWTWLSAGQYHFGLTLLTDQLSVMMMLIVAGVGGLIVAYSVGYMDGEDEERRYFAYMSLFVFSMLLLVQGGSLLMLLVTVPPLSARSPWIQMESVVSPRNLTKRSLLLACNSTSLAVMPAPN